jgi:hypothetical protein
MALSSIANREKVLSDLALLSQVWVAQTAELLSLLPNNVRSPRQDNPDLNREPGRRSLDCAPLFPKQALRKAQDGPTQLRLERAGRAPGCRSNKGVLPMRFRR